MLCGVVVFGRGMEVGREEESGNWVRDGNL